MFAPVRKAVFPVAGLGTRFLPATKAMPKEMLTIVDRPLIQYAVEEAKQAGIEQFIFVTGRGKQSMEDHFDHSYELQRTLAERGKTKILEELLAWLPQAGQVVYTRQQEPLGLGHAVWCARHFIGNEPFAVLLTDELLLSNPNPTQQLIAQYQKTGGNAISVVEVPKEDTKKYGILKTGKDDGSVAEAIGMVEKPEPDVAPSNLALIGRYVLRPEIFDILGQGKRGAGNEIQLTDGMAEMIGQMPFDGVRFVGDRFDCGDKLGFIKANLALGLQRADINKELQQFVKDLAQ